MIHALHQLFAHEYHLSAPAIKIESVDILSHQSHGSPKSLKNFLSLIHER